MAKIVDSINRNFTTCMEIPCIKEIASTSVFLLLCSFMVLYGFNYFVVSTFFSSF